MKLNTLIYFLWTAIFWGQFEMLNNIVLCNLKLNREIIPNAWTRNMTFDNQYKTPIWVFAATSIVVDFTIYFILTHT